MNSVQKATFAASALAITLVGAVLVTAPMLFARPMPVVTNRACSTSSLQFSLAGHAHCDDINRDSRLLAFNRS
jgi:hypothetical protein